MPIKKNYPTFAFETDARLTLGDLTVFAIFHLERHAADFTAEDVVAACFAMFPRRFALRGYPHWPDSAVVGRRWAELRAKGWLARSLKLTARGTRHAAQVEKRLGRPIRQRLRVSERPPTRDSRYVKAVESSEAYRHFKRQKSRARINEFDFRSMLLCTMESSPAALARNLETFKDQVRAEGRKDLAAFLDFCEARFSHLLAEAPPRILKR
ncbi:MAG: hypothetical protein HFACDABA_00756 [Anaerolineales bacterium]|nr:hypothetical protein [Anaerolineales bacterium]